VDLIVFPEIANTDCSRLEPLDPRATLLHLIGEGADLMRVRKPQRSKKNRGLTSEFQAEASWRRM
jgi:hypothetical protein